MGAGPLSGALPCLLPDQTHSWPQARGPSQLLAVPQAPVTQVKPKATGSGDPRTQFVAQSAVRSLSGLNSAKPGLTWVRKLHVTSHCAYFLSLSMSSLKIRTLKSLMHLKFISKARVTD